MPRFKIRRQRRYTELLDKYHFSPREALEFSKLKKDYPALKQMKVIRIAMWANLKRQSNRRGWGKRREQMEWRTRITSFYERVRVRTIRDKDTGLSIEVLTNWIVKKDVHGKPVKPRFSPWEWYDYIFSNLPDELKWDTPRSHRTKGGQGEVKMDKVQTRRWIEDLKRAIAGTDDPARKAQFQEQIKNLNSSLKRK